MIFRFRLSDALYWLVPFMGIYTVSLFYVDSISFFLKPPELAAIFLIALAYPSLVRSRVSKRSVVFVLCILLPLLVSLLVNVFSPVCIDVWSIDISTRVGEGSSRYINNSCGVTSRNITQSLYLIMGLAVFLVCSNVPLDAEKLKKSLRVSIFIAVLVSVFQAVAWYSGYYELYLNTVYNSHPYVEQNLLYKTYGAYKRINGAFAEPSAFGYFLALTLVMYWVIAKQEASRDVLFYSAIVVGILSTSSTFLVMMMVFLMCHVWGKRYVFWPLLFACILILMYFFDNNLALFLEVKLPSYNERLYYALIQPYENFIKSPMVGVAFGTDRPLSGFIAILLGFGILGSIPILALFYFGLRRQDLRLFLLVCAAGWITIPDFHYMFFWVYLGALLGFSNRKYSNAFEFIELRSSRYNASGRPMSEKVVAD